MVGREASRHFSYRVIQAVAPIITKPNQDKRMPLFARNDRSERVLPANKENKRQDNYHQNCPQAVYMRQSATGSQSGRSGKSYSDVLKRNIHDRKETTQDYNIPTANYFNPLNC